MTSHEFDAYLDRQPDEHFDPPYHEPMLVMQEFEGAREATLKQQGALDALAVVKRNLDVVKGGVL